MAKSTREPVEDSKSARTRERIMDSAAFILSRKGFAGTRLVDVADHAQLQAPAIYYYFKSREQLIEEVMFLGVRGMREHVEEALAALPPGTRPIDRIMAGVAVHLRFSLTISDYSTASTRNGSQLPAHLQGRYNEERREYTRVWRTLFADALAAGEIRADLEINSARMLTLGALNWAVEWWRPEGSSTVDALVQTAQSMVLGGIASQESAV